MDVEEEQILSKYLAETHTSENLQLRRKLIVRDLQRKANLNPFDVSQIKPTPTTKVTCKSNLYGAGRRSTSLATNLLRVVSDNDPIYGSERLSPFTGRSLKPYIRRETTMVPPWVCLMAELTLCVGKEKSERRSVDFCYVSAHHVSVINSLCEHFFWPGVDGKYAVNYGVFLTNCLQY